MGRTELRHKKVRIVPRDKATSKTDEARFRAMNENMSGSKMVMAMWTGGNVSGARSEAIGVIGVKSMTGD